LGLRNIFAGIGSRFNSVFQPNDSFKTYRFRFEEDNGISRAPLATYTWVEANRIGDDRYTIQSVEEQVSVSGDSNRTVSGVLINRQNVFSKTEVRAILEHREREFQIRKHTLDEIQPFRAQHYSNIQGPPAESPTNDPYWFQSRRLA